MVNIVLLAATAVFAGTINQWYELGACCSPLRIWLITASCLASALSGVFAIGRHAEATSGAGTCWFVRPRTMAGQAAFTCTWSLLLPAIWAWTGIGVRWLSVSLEHSPECLLSEGPPVRAAVLFVQVLCGFGATAYSVLMAVAWQLARNLRANEQVIKSVEDEDLLLRWGKQEPLGAVDLRRGLPPDKIALLPRHEVNDEVGSCVVCFEKIVKGDNARSLSCCGHAFHRPCIDLWLLRSATCPLCVTHVRVD